MSHVAELQSFLETKIIDLALSTSQDTYPHLSCGGEVKNLVDKLDRFEKEAAISLSPINLPKQVTKQEETNIECEKHYHKTANNPAYVS